MKRTKGPSVRIKKLASLVGEEDPSLASVARLFIYQGDDLYKLEVLASILNDVAPDSPEHSLAELIERLVTCSPAKQDWVRQKELASIIGPTPCIPAPGSPLDALNKFLSGNPCVLRIEGREWEDSDIRISATHVPFVKGYGPVDRLLWLLWEVFDCNLDLTRLKRCPVCNKWFADHTKNKSKARCSGPCTWQRWSWKARKDAGHKSRSKSAKTRMNKRPQLKKQKGKSQ
jgi:hypothetical protein